MIFPLCVHIFFYVVAQILVILMGILEVWITLLTNWSLASVFFFQMNRKRRLPCSGPRWDKLPCAAGEDPEWEEAIGGDAQQNLRHPYRGHAGNRRGGNGCFSDFLPQQKCLCFQQFQHRKWLFFPALWPHRALHFRLSGLHGDEKRSAAFGLHLLLPLPSDQPGCSEFISIIYSFYEVT